MNSLRILVIAAVLTVVNGLGNGTLTVNLCVEPNQLFRNISSIVPGTNLTIYCSVVDGTVHWNSSWFSMIVGVNSFIPVATELDGAVTFNFVSSSVVPPCVTSTATLSNVQESMEGFDLTCQSALNLEMSTTIFDVIDPPGMVMFNTDQDCGNVVINWTVLPNDPCPITGYYVSIYGNSLLLPASQSSYTYSINDTDCGNIFNINISAVSAAGTGNITTNNLTINCTHTNITIVSISGTSAVIRWTPMDVTDVVGYEVMSVAESTGSKATYVLANVNMASVEMDVVYTIPVTFTVASLLPGNQTCYTSLTTLPALKEMNVVSTSSEEGNVTFQFLHMVNLSSLSVNLSPDNGTCVSGGLGMNVTVNCSELTNDVEYTVTIEISLIVEGQSLTVSCSESFTPTAPLLPSSTPSVPVFATIFIHTSTATATPPVETIEPEGEPVALIVGTAVGICVVVPLVIAVILIICIVYVKKKSQKDTDSPVALVKRETKDPQTGEVATYEDPAEVMHEPAPTTGDMYVVEPATYQDPGTIIRQPAPTGDMYTLPQSKQPMPVYAEINKQNEGLQYADLDVIGAGQGGSSRPPDSQEVQYSEVHPSQVDQL